MEQCETFEGCDDLRFEVEFCQAYLLEVAWFVPVEFEVIYGHFLELEFWHRPWPMPDSFGQPERARSRFPSGMTERKARATASAQAGPRPLAKDDNQNTTADSLQE